MSTQRLVVRQHIARPLDVVFPFFEEPENLSRLTPTSNAPLLARLPSRLTPLEEGLRTYLSPISGIASIEFDGGAGPRLEPAKPAADAR